MTSDTKIRRLNLIWRGKDEPTDVLSFPILLPKELRLLPKQMKLGTNSSWVLGDIVISLGTAKAQAEIRGLTLKDELDLLLVHGLLHLLGFDHEVSASEEKKMRRLERILVGKRGLL